MGGLYPDRLPWTGMLKLGSPGHAWIARGQGCHRKALC